MIKRSSKANLLLTLLFISVISVSMFGLASADTSGKLDVGGSNLLGVGYIRVDEIAVDVEFTVNTISMYLSGGGNNANVALFDSSYTLVIEGEEKAIAEASWYHWVFDDETVFAAGTYYLAHQEEAGISVYYDLDATNNSYLAFGYAAFPSPYTGATWANNAEDSLYLDYTVYIAPTATPNPNLELIPDYLEGLMFGSMWYIGLVIFMILAIALMKMWKYAGAFLIPIIMALEVAYFNHNDIYGSMLWPMVILLFLAFGIALYTVMNYQKGKD